MKFWRISHEDIESIVIGEAQELLLNEPAITWMELLRLTVK